MAIRFITAWNGYRADQIVDGLGATEEARLISLKFAVSDLDGPDNNPTQVMASKTLTGGIKLSSPVVMPLVQAMTTAFFKPWKIASFGDSRSNTGSTGPDVSGSQLISNVRAPGWAVAHMGDAELTRNYGITGDNASGWAAVARTGGKTFADLNASDVDAVIVQYGINDAQALTAAPTIFGYLQALCAEIMKSGKVVLFESINPVNSPVASYASVQAIVDAVNDSMSAWLGNFPESAIYIDTATALKLPNGFANPAYYQADNLHFVQTGAYLSGKLIASAARSLLAKRPGAFPAVDSKSPNLLNLMSPSTFSIVETGTASAITVTNGQDASGYYSDFTWTPATLTSGECRVQVELAANFLTSATPYYALTGQEILQASARVICDNGSGNAPSAYSVAMRQRFYTATVFRDWGTIPPGAPTALTPDFSEKLDVRMTTPPVQNTAASVSAAPALGSGYQMQIFVSSQVVGVPVRVRVYNPQLKVVGYNKTPVSVTPPASASAFTNSTTMNQQIVISGGTVSAIAQNGVSTGLTSGVFVLAPGDTLTPTYTVAPTMLVKHF